MSYEQTLVKIIEPVKRTTITRMNRGKKWQYGYNKEHDVIVISKTGMIGEIYEIQNLKIALAPATKVYSRSKKKQEQYWEEFEYPKALKNVFKSIGAKLKSVGAKAAEIFKTIGNIIKKVKNFLKGGVGKVLGLGKNIFKAGKNFVIGANSFCSLSEIPRDSTIVGSNKLVKGVFFEGKNNPFPRAF